jgi:hypothetical protein
MSFASLFVRELLSLSVCFLVSFPRLLVSYLPKFLINTRVVNIKGGLLISAPLRHG